MALFDTTFYVSSVGHAAVTVRPQNTAVAAGVLARQASAPSVGNERVFVCIVAGTTQNVADATWTLTRGAKTTDGTVTWQECTGITAVNGDLTNTPNWTTVKNTAITLGVIIKRNGLASYQICTTAGTAGNAAEPSFSDTAGTTTADNTVTWTSLGVVGNFTGGQAPHARLANAIASTWAAAGGTIYLKSDHAETQATTITLTGTSTIASPHNWLCHNGSAYPPASANITTGASITATSTSNININALGVYMYGITFNAGSGSGNTVMQIGLGADASHVIAELCDFIIPSTNALSEGTNIGGGATTTQSYIELRNCRFKFASVSMGLRFLFAKFVWKNDAATAALISGTSIPTAFIRPLGSTANLNIVEIEGCDLSSISGTLVTTTGALQAMCGRITFTNCSLHATATKYDFSSTFPSYGLTVDFVRCNSGAVNYSSEHYAATGSEIAETTIVHTGGATDGAQAQSRKIVTTSRCVWHRPYEAVPITFWNNVTGSAITITVFGIWGGGAVPNNDDIWADVLYLGSSGNPAGTRLSGTKSNILTTGSAQTSDSSTWGGSTTAFKMTATITPQMKGPVTIFVRAGAVSNTFYVDPKPVISGQAFARSYIVAPAVYVNEPANPVDQGLHTIDAGIMA